MANPYDFTTTARGDILHHPKSPHNFLPTSLKQHEGDLIWTAPGYATYGATPTNDTILYSSCAVYCYKLEQSIILPQNMQRISEETNITDAKKSYIAQYRNAAATIDHYFKTNQPNDRFFERAISEWKSTCDKLIKNPHFADGWNLPAFYPFYTDACDNAITNFFTKQKENNPNDLTLWTKRMQHAKEMHVAWQQMFLYVTSPNNIAFPKCLWYHKFFYVYETRQSELWRSFFDGNNFSDLAKIE